MNLQQHQLEERYALTAFLTKILINDNDYEWVFENTYQDSKTPYDAVAIKYNRVTRERVKIYLIEAKIRSKSYDSLLLEKQKYERLLAVVNKNPGITEAFYINFMETNAVMFNLTKLKGTMKWEERLQPKMTIRPELGMIKKKVWMIPNEKGKTIDFEYKKEWLKHQLEQERKKMWSEKKTFDLNKYLFPED